MKWFVFITHGNVHPFAITLCSCPGEIRLVLFSCFLLSCFELVYVLVSCVIDR